VAFDTMGGYSVRDSHDTRVRNQNCEENVPVHAGWFLTTWLGHPGEVDTPGKLLESPLEQANSAIF